MGSTDPESAMVWIRKAIELLSNIEDTGNSLANDLLLNAEQSLRRARRELQNNMIE